MGEKRYLTVAELAEITGKSKQYIYRLKSTRLNNYLTTIDNQIFIDKKALSEVFGIDELNEVEQPVEQPNQPTADTGIADIIGVLRAELHLQQESIKVYQEQLQQKDAQILHLQQALEREQQITAAHLQRELLVLESTKNEINASQCEFSAERSRDPVTAVTPDELPAAESRRHWWQFWK